MALCTVCDDGDPCTVDTCGPEGCRHEALTGWEAARCVCGVIPDAITRRIERAEHLMSLAATTPAPANAKRLRAKAARNFRRAISLTAKATRRGRLAPACAGTLEETLASELTRARTLNRTSP